MTQVQRIGLEVDQGSGLPLATLKLIEACANQSSKVLTLLTNEGPNLSSQDVYKLAEIASNIESMLLVVGDRIFDRERAAEWAAKGDLTYDV